jgi:hypothetical protein
MMPLESERPEQLSALVGEEDWTESTRAIYTSSSGRRGLSCQDLMRCVRPP